MAAMLSSYPVLTGPFVAKTNSKIYGLSYQPSQTEHAQNPRIVGTLIKDLNQDYSTAERNVVGYEGGHVDKDVLTQLNIPSLHLEAVGCPKYRV